jgi:hypothetical protein
MKSKWKETEGHVPDMSLGVDQLLLFFLTTTFHIEAKYKKKKKIKEKLRKQRAEIELQMDVIYRSEEREFSLLSESISNNL